jgi:hypothetical protein
MGKSDPSVSSYTFINTRGIQFNGGLGKELNFTTTIQIIPPSPSPPPTPQPASTTVMDIVGGKYNSNKNKSKKNKKSKNKKVK